MAEQCGDQDGWAGLPIKEEKEFCFDSNDEESITKNSGHEIDEPYHDSSCTCTPVSIKMETFNSSAESCMKSEHLSEKSEFFSRDELCMKMLDHENSDHSYAKRECDMLNVENAAQIISRNDPIQHQVLYVTPVMESATIKTEPEEVINNNPTTVKSESLSTQTVYEGHIDNEQLKPNFQNMDYENNDPSYAKSEFDMHDAEKGAEINAPIQQHEVQNITPMTESEILKTETDEMILENIVAANSELLRTQTIYEENIESKRPESIPQDTTSFGSPVIIAPIGSDTDEKPFVCRQCDERFLKPGQLAAHFRIHEEKLFSCNLCDKKFPNLNTLRSHVTIHTEERPFICNQCNRVFSLATHSKMHMTKNTEERPISCEQCDKIFKQSSRLMSHKTTLKGEKPFICDQCDKRFAYSNGLKTHLRIHTKGMFFSCDFCDKRFVYYSHLKKHQATHAGEKPFSCDQCDKRFTYSQALKAHSKTHTEGKLFGCNQCDKRFRNSWHLKEHQVTHSGEKPFSCDQCDKMFIYSKGLKNHLKSHK